MIEYSLVQCFHLPHALDIESRFETLQWFRNKKFLLHLFPKIKKKIFSEAPAFQYYQTSLIVDIFFLYLITVKRDYLQLYGVHLTLIWCYSHFSETISIAPDFP